MNSDRVAALRIPGPSRRGIMPVLYCCLFLSGAAGLANEVLWTRILGLSFGHTTSAVTTVLAVYMGGLALGSRFLGELADRVSRPLRLYGILEIGIGIYCLAAPGLLASARKIYATADFIPDGSSLHAVLRVALAFLALIVPTTLMGGTLPAVCRALVYSPPDAGRKVGFLYGVNTIGAAFGAFAVGYWLLPSIGVRATNHLVVAANLFAGAAVLLFFSRDTIDTLSANGATRTSSPGRDPLETLLLWSFAISGAVGMSYQIVWIRALILVIGSSTYAFSAILVTFLLGISLGGFLFSRLHRRNSFRFFAILQFGIALAAFTLIPIFDGLPGLFFSLFRGFKGLFGYILFSQFLVVFTVVLLPTTLMGMTFPCITGLLTRHVGDFGGKLGRFYAYNTGGAIAGSLLTGFFLLPSLGAQGTLALGIGLSGFMGAAVLFLTEPAKKKALAFLILPICLVSVLFPKWDRQIMSSGVFYLGAGVPHLDELTASRFAEIVYFKEGISSTIAVARFQNGSKGLLVNGKVDAGDNDMETQVNLAYIPLLLHHEPRKVAVVGLGAGVTAGTATLFTETEEIDVIELEPAVVEASAYFVKENLKALEDPRVRVILDDGRSYLEGRKDSYDVIISQPSNPWMSGINNLFTREFFTLVREKLNPGGIFCQWLQGYSLTPEDLKMVARTFLEVFPEATLWLASEREGDLILLGRTNEGGTIDSEVLISRSKKISRPEELSRVFGDSSLERLFASFLLGSKGLRAYAGLGPLNTDDLPLLEFRAPRALYLPAREHSNKPGILAHKASTYPSFIVARQFDTPAAHIRMGKYLLNRDRFEEAAREFTTAYLLNPRPHIPRPRNETGATIRTRPIRGLSETFDGGEYRLPLFPRLGGYRPDDSQGKDLAVWSASIDYFNEISGVAKGTGKGGTKGLVINGIAGIVSAGYFAPLSVKPSTTYTVEFSMKSDLKDNGEAGVGRMEFDTLIPAGEELPRELYVRHILDTRKEVTVRGKRDWNRYSFSFQTSARTRMAHIFFFREGSHDRKPVVFDDILIHEGRRHSLPEGRGR